MLEQEIAKELTLEAIKKIDTRFGTSYKASERNELLAKNVGEMYQEIFQSVVNANNSTTK